MDLTELADRSGVDRRKLRYVLDHDLVPELHIVIHDKEWGRPRYFAEDVGFGIVCAARLLEAGFRHDTIKGFLRALIEIKFKPGDPLPALAYVLQRQELPSYADFGDELAIRLRVGGHDFGWVTAVKKAKPIEFFDPVVTITLNIGFIRDQVFSRR